MVETMKTTRKTGFSDFYLAGVISKCAAAGMTVSDASKMAKNAFTAPYVPIDTSVSPEGQSELDRFNGRGYDGLPKSDTTDYTSVPGHASPITTSTGHRWYSAGTQYGANKPRKEMPYNAVDVKIDWNDGDDPRPESFNDWKTRMRSEANITPQSGPAGAPGRRYNGASGGVTYPGMHYPIIGRRGYWPGDWNGPKVQLQDPYDYQTPQHYSPKPFKLSSPYSS